MRALALLMLLPTAAFAQTVIAPAAPEPPPPVPAAAGGPEPSECTVTTTVRCTGAAAPYAVQAAQPQVVVPPPAPPAPPPPAAPPQYMPPPYGQPAVILDPRQLGDGWKLVQTPDGCLWRERKVSTDSPAVWGTGMAFWLGGYAAGIIGGMQQGGANYFAWWPIIGAFVNTSFNSGGAQAAWAIDGIAQAGGFVTFLIGLAAGPDKLERRPLSVGPAAFVGGGNGVALQGRF